MARLSDLWHALTTSTEPLTGEIGGRSIAPAVVDSRAAIPGALFVALRGEQTDGHLFIGDALNRGAAAVIAEPRALQMNLGVQVVTEDGQILQPDGSPGEELAIGDPVMFIVSDSLRGLQRLATFWRTQMSVRTVAVTGSVGKTTSKEIIANVLSQRFTTLRSEGNYNNEVGLPLTLLRLTNAHQRLVLEMGMYAVGEIASLCELAQPHIGVVTNIGPTHLERLGSIERIALAKSELVQALPPENQGGVAILNADDPLVMNMSALTRARLFTYGLNPQSDLWADEIVSEGLDGVRFRMHFADDSFHVKLPMLGRHSVHTALRGAAVGLAEGLSWTEIIQGLQDVRGQLRLMVVAGAHDTMLIDDTYNASPASMLAALNLLQDIANGSRRSIAVLGEMYELGTYEETGHRLVGGRAAQITQKLVTIGERAHWIADEAVAAGMLPEDVYAVETNEEAVQVMCDLMQPGDIILIKGSRAAAMEKIVDALSSARQHGR